MRTVQSREIAAAGGTARMKFGPFKTGDIVIGLHVVGSYETAVTPFTIAAAADTDAQEPAAAAGFAALEQLFGSDGAGGFAVPLPPGTSVFVPLDLEFNRNSWLIVEGTNPDALETLGLTIGIERALNQVSLKR